METFGANSEKDASDRLSDSANLSCLSHGKKAKRATLDSQLSVGIFVEQFR